MTTVSDLSLQLKELTVDQNREVLCQLVGQQGGAWNLHFRLDALKTGMAVLTISHPDLLRLPAINFGAGLKYPPTLPAVPLLNTQMKFTGQQLTGFEASKYIATLERRLADIEGELQRRRISIDDWRRADQNVLCETCGKRYIDHPYGGELTHDRELILHRLCDGSLVKL